MSIATIDGISAPGRGDLSSSRLEEHLRITAKFLKKLGIRSGASVASALPDGPDATTAAMTVKMAHADFVPLGRSASLEQYQSSLVKTHPKLLLLHFGAHPARDAARNLGIPIANVLRHFEAGLFTLEADVTPAWSQPPAPPAWKARAHGIPVVLIAPGPAHRRLANRLAPVVGITPPKHLPLPHTVEHIAAECVRILRRSRPEGPYALAGWRADGVVALEMARLLEEEGEKVVFVAMLDASSLFPSWFKKLLHIKSQYHPVPWFGRILHLGPSRRFPGWRQVAPHGLTSYQAPSEMLAEPNVQIVAAILAAELLQAKNP